MNYNIKNISNYEDLSQITFPAIKCVRITLDQGWGTRIQDSYSQYLSTEFPALVFICTHGFQSINTRASTRTHG